jgi:nucleoside-diphosphate-sugar epimerase
MRVFVCGGELGIGFVIAQRLLAEGHKVNILTRSEDLVPNLTKNGMSPVLGGIQDAVTQLAKADAVIDVELPFTFPLKRVRVGHLRPALLRAVIELRIW